MRSKYDDDVIQAVRDGKRLCGSCLGRKVVVRMEFADFVGDRERITLHQCADCRGTGLENGKG